MVLSSNAEGPVFFLVRGDQGKVMGRADPLAGTILTSIFRASASGMTPLMEVGGFVFEAL